MYRDHSDRIESINEAIRNILTEGKYKMYDPETRTVVDSDAPGANRVFGEGEKAHIYQGGKKVYLNRPSYNKPLIDPVKTQPTKILSTTVPAEGKVGTVPTGTSAPVIITKPAIQPERRKVSDEPKVTDPLSSLAGPFKTTQKPVQVSKPKPDVPVAGLRGQPMTMAEPEPQERMSKVRPSKGEIDTGLEAVYKYGKTIEMPLASHSELLGFTKQDIENARRAAIAPKPKPPARPITGGRGRLEIEPMYTESVENYANYLGEARGDGFTKKARRRAGAKAAKQTKGEPPATEQPSALGTIGDLINQAYAPLDPSEPRPVSREDRTTQREQKNAAARNKGEAAARKYLETHPKKTGVIASILKILGKSK